MHFKDEFKKLYNLWFLDADSNTDVLTLNCVRMLFSNRRINEFEEHFNNHLLSAEGHKCPLNMCISRSLKNQFIINSADPETEHCLS